MRNFSKAKRIVIKIGTNILAGPDGRVNAAYVRKICRQVAQLVNAGRQVAIITSGAIGMGAGELKLEKRISSTKMRQACAAIGQPLLMAEYRKSFARDGIKTAQVLLTAEVLSERKTYLNLRNAVETLLKLGVVPIMNENDSVSTDEIGTAFGDNDKLSALVASKLDADLLIMLSDIDGLYTQDPRRYTDAEHIDAVFEVTAAMLQRAGGAGSRHATGGMKTKLEAARIAAHAGCRMVLADGKAANVITRILEGKPLGTVFMPKRKLSNRKRWILNSKVEGEIRIDAGAAKAIANKKSLLPKGITAVKGDFEAGAVVMLNDTAKAVSGFSSAQLRQLIGRHSSEIKAILGPGHRDVAAIPEDIVLIDY